MRDDALLTYLNDHLGGSVSALEIVRKITGREGDSRLGDIGRRLHDEITEDQAVVQRLIAAFDGSESTVKKATAWIVEKVGRLKLSSDSESMALTLLEELETLALGIDGKLALWVGLERLAGETADARLAALDFAALQARARAQHAQVEALRQEAVLAAFA